MEGVQIIVASGRTREDVVRRQKDVGVVVWHSCGLGQERRSEFIQLLGDDYLQKDLVRMKTITVYEKRNAESVTPANLQSKRFTKYFSRDLE